MPGGALPSVARRAVRSRSAERFAKTPRHRLTPPSHQHVLALPAPVQHHPLTAAGSAEGTRRWEAPLSPRVPHGHDLPAGRQAGGGTWARGVVREG